MILWLAVWILVVGQIGFSESFPNRPTASELDNIVAWGTECVKGVNERCQATQYATNPVAYRVAPFTNTTFYLDQSLMGTMASKIKALVPYYVDPDTVYDGTTNIVMLTVTGLWAQLEIGDGTNQFTYTPAIGTNAATYGDNPWRVTATNLDERYKVLNALEARWRQATTVDKKYYYGEGCGTTYVDAVTAAQSDYHQTNSMGGMPWGQWSKVALWSNYYSTAPPGAWCNGTPYGSNYDNPITGYHLSVVQTDNYYTVTNLFVTCTNYPSTNVTCTTNLVATGDGDTDPSAVLTNYNYEDGTVWRAGWERDIELCYDVWVLTYYDDGVPLPRWAKMEGGPPVGDYPPFINCTGTVHVAWGTVNAITNVTDARASCGGLYIYQGVDGNGNRTWSCASNGFDIAFAGNGWKIYTGAQVDFTNSSYLGSYFASGHPGNATVVESKTVYPGRCGDDVAGDYANHTHHPGAYAAGDYWGLNAHGYQVYFDGAIWAIHTDSLPSNGWQKLDANPVGEYVSYGTGFYGTVHATIVAEYGNPHWDPIWQVNTWTGGVGVGATTIFYQCWMAKVGWSNSVFATTNLTCASSHYVNPVVINLGTVNEYYDQGLGWESNVWNNAGLGSRVNGTNETKWLGETLSTQPGTAAEWSWGPNTTYAKGFLVDLANVLLDWAFNY